jgi:predicted TIM-barrel fold metal-dependent hydrolase
MIVDADAHVAECVELFEEYLDPAYADRRPKLIPMRKFRGWWDFDGLILPRQSGKGRGPEAGFAVGAECNDVASRRAFMADERIDLMVLYPTTLIAACSFADRDYACALARAYNDWLADYCRACGPDVKGVAIVALQEPTEAIKELRRAVDELGLLSVVIPSMIGDRLVGDDAFLPFYEAAQALDVAVGLHDVTGAYDLPGQQLFESFFAAKVIARPHAFQTALLSLMERGIFERFPALRVALLENGVAWLPYWLERMDTFYGMQVERGFASEDIPWLRRPPSEYLRRGQIYCHCESDERTLPEVLSFLGDDVCFYASDFPHEEVQGSELKRLQARTDVTPTALAGILGTNALRLYGPRLGAAVGAPGAARATV